MNQKDTAIKSYNLLREFLIENNCLPYHEAKFPPQFIETFGLAKKTDDELINQISESMLKLDELIQLFNVLIGDMSLVSPRPNVLSETSLYTDVEKKLLTVKPGITDFSSIIFSDLAEILEGSDDANLKYNQYVRPWKSRLSLFYIRNHNLIVDLRLIFFTTLSLVSRRKALNGVVEILKRMKAPENLIEVAKREKELVAFPPPGSDKIVSER